LLREALSHFEEDGRARSHAWVLTWYGRAGRAGIGEVDGRTPEQWFAQALDEFEALGDGAGMGWSLTLLARCALRVGDLTLADERARSALDLAEAGGIDQVAANAHRWLAVIAHARGDTGRADELIARATQEHEDSGDRWHQAIALATAAGLAVGRQDVERAADVLTAAFAIVDELPGADEATAHVLVAALNFLVHTGHGTEVASIVGGLSASDNALVERVALIQDPEHLRVDLATVQPDPPDGESLTSAMARASTIVAGVTGRV
jgi:hypothetical protein